MKILTNPVLLRAAIVLFCSTFAFLMGLIFMRMLRKSIEEDANISSEGTPTLETLPLHLYNTVIQQLKQQKHELQVQTQEEQRRARTTENFSQIVLSNLSSGVLVFGTNGLVKQSNPAAKEILGFASPSSMSAEDIFRGAVVISATGTPSDDICPNVAEEVLVHLADEVYAVLREGAGHRQVEASYITPSDEQRLISVTISPVPAADGTLLGAACLINDLSEFERIRQQQELHGEISAEMALDLRTSLTSISGLAQQLAENCDPEFARQLAADIASEAARLDRSIGGFLTEKRTLKSAAAAAGAGEQA